VTTTTACVSTDGACELLREVVRMRSEVGLGLVVLIVAVGVLIGLAAMRGRSG
jgi:hypothetical protein